MICSFRSNEAGVYGVKEAVVINMIRNLEECMPNYKYFIINEQKYYKIDHLLHLFPFWNKKNLMRVIKNLQFKRAVLIEQFLLIKENYISAGLRGPSRAFFISLNNHKIK